MKKEYEVPEVQVVPIETNGYIMDVTGTIPNPGEED